MPASFSTFTIALLLQSAAAPIAAPTVPLSPVAHPEIWPTANARPSRDPKVEARIDAIMKRMSVEDKIGQLIQVDIASIEPSDLRTYKLGSILNGGNAGPHGNDLAPPVEWLKLADDFYDASLRAIDAS
ncbi:MAG: 1,4-beta-D-glucan glucohydrolase, partial [Sphingomonas sp.]